MLLMAANEGRVFTEECNMKAQLQFSAAMAVFGTISIFVRAVPVSSATLALLRAVIALAFLAALRALSGRPFELRRMGGDSLPLLLSGAAIGFNWILLFEAYKYTTVSIATLCYYFAPAIVTAASAVLFHERLTRRQLLCFLGATVGMVLTVGLDGFSGVVHPLGVAFGLGAAVLYAAVMLLNKQIRSVDGVDRTVVQFFAAVIVLTPYLLLTEGFHMEGITACGWASLAILGIGHTGLAYCVYFSSLPKLRGQQAAILSYIDPLIAVLLSVLFLKEPTSVLQLTGGAMLLGFTLSAGLTANR